MYVLFTYLFCYRFPLKGVRANSRVRKGSCGVIQISAVSLTSRNPNFANDYPLQWHFKIHGILYKIFYVRSRGVIDTAESELCKRLSRISRRNRSHMQNGISP
jgi:hypothetical protein